MRRTIAAFFTLHLLIVGAYSTTAALRRFHRPGSASSEADPVSRTGRPLLLWWATYCRYTALEADYGFFSPDVGPALDLEVSVLLPGDRLAHFEVPAGGLEASYRYQTALLALMNRAEYRDLVARSHAARALDVHPDALGVKVEVRRFILPSMAEWRKGERGEWQTAFEAVFANVRAVGGSSEHEP